jgi:uncharacterized protein
MDDITLTLSQNPGMPLNTPLSDAELARLDDFLMSEDGPINTMDVSMLDGYLAAVASGPNLVMPDQMLQWIRDTEDGDARPKNQAVTNLVIRQYQAVNDALNDKVYVPVMADTQAWCRGYLAGFAADMTAWAPLMAAQPGLLKVIMATAENRQLDTAKADLAEVARRIHAFWLERRRSGSMLDGLLGQLAALSPAHATLPNQRPH